MPNLRQPIIYTRDQFTIKDKLGWTPFHWACKNGHFQIAELILQKSIQLNIELDAKDVNSRTPLHLACIKGHLNIAEMILEKSVILNIDITATNLYGQTAYEEANINGHSKTAEMLVKKCTELHINLISFCNLKNGETPLHLATRMGDFEMFKNMIENSPPLKIKLNVKGTYEGLALSHS